MNDIKVFAEPKDAYQERINAAYDRMQAHLAANGYVGHGDEGEYDWERHQDVETATLNWLAGTIDEASLREQLTVAWEKCANGYDKSGEER